MAAINSVSSTSVLVDDEETRKTRNENLKSSVDSTTGLNDGQIGQAARLKALDEESVARTADEQRRRGVNAQQVIKAPVETQATAVATSESVKLSDLDPYIRA